MVYGHGGEQVPDALRADDLIFVKQEPQLGTGHAVQQALPHLDARQRDAGAVRRCAADPRRDL